MIIEDEVISQAVVGLRHGRDFFAIFQGHVVLVTGFSVYLLGEENRSSNTQIMRDFSSKLAIQSIISRPTTVADVPSVSESTITRTMRFKWKKDDSKNVEERDSVVKIAICTK